MARRPAPPVCRGLATYPLEEQQRPHLHLNPLPRRRRRCAATQKTYQLRVVSNRNVATFIKELVLEPLAWRAQLAFTPGDYLQFDIPAYETIRFRDFDIPEPFAAVWEAPARVRPRRPQSPRLGRRNNYSLASNRQTEGTLRFNVRIATPPPGQDCPPGVGSSYVFSLKPGDMVTAIGPFGDFHIKPTQREMVYIGGGAGMAPLRAHLSHLLETEKTARKVSFWYGARSRQEIFYDDYFRELAPPASQLLPSTSRSRPRCRRTTGRGHTGFIHEVVLENHLAQHANPRPCGVLPVRPAA